MAHPVLHTQNPGGIVGRHPDGVLQGNAHGDGRLQDPEEMVGGTGDGAVGQAGDGTVQEDLLAAQPVDAVCTAAARETVADEAQPRGAEGPVSQPHDAGMDVEAALAAS